MDGGGCPSRHSDSSQTLAADQRRRPIPRHTRLRRPVTTIATLPVGANERASLRRFRTGGRVSPSTLRKGDAFDGSLRIDREADQRFARFSERSAGLFPSTSLANSGKASVRPIAAGPADEWSWRDGVDVRGSGGGEIEVR